MKPLLPLRIMELKRLTIMDFLEHVRREKNYDGAYRTAHVPLVGASTCGHLGFLEYDPACDIGAAITATREGTEYPHRQR